VKSMSEAVATFGGGCFWCLEAVFERLQGVSDVTSGYSGGEDPNPPTYERVCGGRTGHAEVVRITFDPEQVSFTTLLEVFFLSHDPTTLNRQGADIGTQYRSVVFFHDAEQESATRAMVSRLDASGELSGPVVTQVVPACRFFPAEEYHQDYFRRNPYAPYCQVVVAAKVSKLLKKHPEWV
jgi:peptide-methionine (S)-S-oxide reductase